MPTSQATLTGTYDLASLLAARFTAAAEFGLDTIQPILAADLAAHNAIVNSMISELAEMTTDRQRLYGASVGGEMVEVDEYGRSPTQKDAPGSTVGFPLKKFQYAIGWTNEWLKIHTPADMAIATQAAEKAHLRRIQLEIKKAIFLSTNYTWPDYLVDNVSLPVKRFVNADSAAIPQGPNGEVFVASTHTHYDANATLTAAALTAEINDVIEHGYGGNVYVVINKADEAAVRALTGFTPYTDARLTQALGTPIQRLDMSRLDNRAIGIFSGAEVWVKSWGIANYAFVYDSASPQKPVAFRQRSQTTMQGLRIVATLDTFPLHAQFLEADYGIGVWTRTNGAVLYFAGGSYVDPTL